MKRPEGFLEKSIWASLVLSIFYARYEDLLFSGFIVFGFSLVTIFIFWIFTKWISPKNLVFIMIFWSLCISGLTKLFLSLEPYWILSSFLLYPKSLLGNTNKQKVQFKVFEKFFKKNIFCGVIFLLFVYMIAMIKISVSSYSAVVPGLWFFVSILILAFSSMIFTKRGS